MVTTATDTAGGTPGEHRIELAPNCSLTPRSARLFVGSLALVTFGLAGFFAVRGLWPARMGRPGQHAQRREARGDRGFGRRGRGRAAGANRFTPHGISTALGEGYTARPATGAAPESAHDRVARARL